MIREQSQAQKAYETLKEYIITQKLKPGSPIVENELAENLEMSRTPIREAIRRLQADGLVEIKPRRGAFIKTFSKKDLMMYYEAAEALEGMAVYLIAKNYSKGNAVNKKLIELEELVQQMNNHLENNDMNQWASCDEKFHDTLYDLCENSYIVQNLKKIRIQINCVLWFLTPMYIDKKASNAEHSEIVSSIKAGDAERARTAAQRQRNRVREELDKIVYSFVL